MALVEVAVVVVHQKTEVVAEVVEAGVHRLMVKVGVEVVEPLLREHWGLVLAEWEEEAEAVLHLCCETPIAAVVMADLRMEEALREFWEAVVVRQQRQEELLSCHWFH